MSARRVTAAAAALLAAATILLAPACGGGGGGGGPTEPPPPPPPTSGITFNPASTGGNSTVTLVRMGSGNDRLSLQVQANNVNDFYGAGFDVQFPTALFTFGGFDEGTFLGSGGNADAFQVAENPAGNLVIGATRLGAVGGASGSGTVMVLHFDAVANGNGQIAFSDAQAFDANGAPTGVSFSGGSVMVNR